MIGAPAVLPKAAIPMQVLVKPKSGISETDFLSRIHANGAEYRRALRRSNVHVITALAGNAAALARKLALDPEIEYAEVDGLAQAAFVPNDTYVTDGAEWHLEKIQAPAAWDYTVGAGNTIVAFLDSGVNAAHPEFVGRILPGYNFIGGTADTTDDFGHGTAVAGTIAAAGNNNIGVAGVAYGCQLLPVKVVDSTGFATYSDIADGIYFAVENGAKVINISIAGSTPSVTLQTAVDFAWSNNVVIVAAAGNNANSSLQYPAACARVVSVSATTSSDSLADFSTFGSWVTMSAPGDNIWTTDRDLSSPYGSWRGTSFSSPIVASVAALMLSVNPSLSTTQVVSLMATNADDLGASGPDAFFGSGRVNAFNSILAAIATPGAIMTGPQTQPRPAPEPGATNGSALTFASLPKSSRYAGLVADTNGVSITNGGYVALSFRSTGKFSGRLSLAGKRYGFSGLMSESGVARFSIGRKLNSPINVDLRFDSNTGLNEMFVGVAADGWRSEGVAERNIFQARTNPAPQFGRRGFALQQPSAASMTVAAGIARIARGGSAKLHGRLSSGAAFSVGSTLANTGDYPFYLSRKHGTELMLGWIQFSASPASQTSGTVLWLNSGTNSFEKELQVASVPLP